MDPNDLDEELPDAEDTTLIPDFLQDDTTINDQAQWESMMSLYEHGLEPE